MYAETLPSAITADDLLAVLQYAWDVIAAAHDVAGPLPSMPALFVEVDLAAPQRAAETVLVNMLTEVMEQVGRFSRWYRQPARAYGMVQCERGGRVGWVLAEDARQRWQPLLERLAHALEKNIGLVLSATLLDELEDAGRDEDCVLACCQCQPARTIFIRRALLAQADIICATCEQPYRLVA